MATEVVEVATESEGDVVIFCEEEEEGAEKRTNFVDIVGLHVRAVSVFGKKSDAVCGFLVYFCMVLRFLDPPYTPLSAKYPGRCCFISFSSVTKKSLCWSKRV